MTVSEDQPALAVGIGASASGFAAFKSFLARAPAGTGMERRASSHPVTPTEMLARALKLHGMEVRDEPKQQGYAIQ